MRNLIGMTRSDTIVSGTFKHICQIGEKFRQEGAEVVYAFVGNCEAIDKLRASGFKVHALTNKNVWKSVLINLTKVYR